MSNGESETLVCILFIGILVGILCIISYIIGIDVGRDRMKQEIVEKGFAEWTLNSEREIEFKWVLPKERSSKDDD